MQFVDPQDVKERRGSLHDQLQSVAFAGWQSKQSAENSHSSPGK